MSDVRLDAPGDELLTGANMVFDHAALIDASPGAIWPWLVQLGKHRAGWYLPARLERFLPRRRRALHTIDPRWQAIAVGDRVPDYGGRDEWLEVARIDPPRLVVYRSERRGRPFTWALLLEPVGGSQTRLRLRFRGRIHSHGLRRRVVLAVGGFFDWSTGQLMIRGLRDRLTESGAKQIRPPA